MTDHFRKVIVNRAHALFKWIGCAPSFNRDRLARRYLCWIQTWANPGWQSNRVRFRFTVQG
jgi:hypothetical protein